MAFWTVFAVFLVIYLFLHKWANRFRTYPENLPWVGRSDWPFSIFIANCKDIFNGRANVQYGYDTFNKRGRAFISPMYHRHPEVILPRSMLQWLVDQPDDVLSVGEVLQEDLHFPYTSPGSWDFSHPYHVEALNKMRLDPLTPGLVEEIQRSIDELWGLREDWHDVSLEGTIYQTLLATTNRAIVGAPLCHDKSYNANVKAFITAIGMQSMKISFLVPRLLRPLLARLLARPVRRTDAQCAAELLPLISARLQTAELALIDPSFTRTDENTLLDWTVRLAAKTGERRDKDPTAIASRLLSLSFVGVHTSFNTLSNALQDLIASPASLYAALRVEAEEVLHASAGVWSKSSVAKLVLMDSFLRESMRMHVFKARGVERQVIASQGARLPDGTFLPRGTRLGLPTHGIQHDDAIYEDAAEFDAWRFVGKGRNMAMVNTGDDFLAFGHGRHACPGRFFSAHELKLLVAYLVMRYDIRLEEGRAENIWAADFCVPRNDIVLTVRRREGGEGCRTVM